MGSLIGYIMEAGVAYTLAAILHELGHAIAGELFGSPVKKMKLTWAGLCVVRDAGSPLPNLLISSAGPLISLAVGLAAWNRWDLFAIANLCIFLANVSPIQGSDGDRIWMCAVELAWMGGRRRPDRRLGRDHAWLLERGLSRWDLEQMELAEPWPPAPGSHRATKNGIPELFVTTYDT